MAKYDGLIIPRSYNDYVNKSDPIGVSQALQLTGVMDNVPTAQSTKPAKSGGIFAANAVIMASSATLTGVAISAGSVVRVLFTAALTGSDATTGLTITYNGNTYAVKVGKDGALVALTAHLIEESYIYLQAYTTLELAFDGSQFVVMGNPVVISNADFSIMADGSITYTSTATNRKYPIIERFVQILSPNQTVDFHVADSKMYLLAESGSYATATSNLFMISTGTSAERSIFKINGTNGSLQFVDSNTIRFTYEYQGGGDSCNFSLISLY